jgi:hypothetical protein
VRSAQKHGLRLSPFLTPSALRRVVCGAIGPVPSPTAAALVQALRPEMGPGLAAVFFYGSHLSALAQGSAATP